MPSWSCIASRCDRTVARRADTVPFFLPGPAISAFHAISQSHRGQIPTGLPQTGSIRPPCDTSDTWLAEIHQPRPL